MSHQRRRLPRVVFDYIDGGADAERTLREIAARLTAIRDPETVLVLDSEVNLRNRVQN